MRTTDQRNAAELARIHTIITIACDVEAAGSDYGLLEYRLSGPSPQHAIQLHGEVQCEEYLGAEQRERFTAEWYDAARRTDWWGYAP